MKLPASSSAGRFPGNKNGPRRRAKRQIEGLTTRRHDLLMAGTHPMYVCPRLGGNLPTGKGRTDG